MTIFLAVFVLLCGAGVAVALLYQKPSGSAALPGSQYAAKTIRLGGQTYTLQVADTPEKQELGLGQRDNLGPRTGMLFSYAEPAMDRCFWMKDMRFSIDIIWLDASKRIVKIEPSLSPATYPKTYCPSQPAQYVIELNAGQVHDLGLQTGQQLSF